jgi:hypothetical protein
MRSLKWRILVQVEGIEGRRELREVACFERPLDGAMPADFGLSLAEGQELLRQLQTLVTQDQIRAYDGSRRHCRRCGRYRRIKDWRARQFDTALGHVDVRVPRVMSCLCTPEPLDDKGEPIDLRFSECSIEPLLPGRTTPEVAYWCARKGVSYPYRSAARQVCEMTGLTRFSHMRVRRETLRAGEFGGSTGRGRVVCASSPTRSLALASGHRRDSIARQSLRGRDEVRGRCRAY